MRIFISYRRAASAGQAGRLYDRLASAFGAQNVFMDVDKIPAGETFESYILHEIERCDVFLAMLSEGTLGTSDHKRIFEDDDWVRREIVYALTLPNVRVIPVLIDNFPMPNKKDLPEDLHPLRTLNAVFLLHQLFEETSSNIIGRIKAVEIQSKRHLWVVIAATLIVILIAISALFVTNQQPQATKTPEPFMTTDSPTTAILSVNTLASTIPNTPTPSNTPTPTHTQLPTSTFTLTFTNTATSIPAPTLRVGIDTRIMRNAEWQPHIEEYERDFDGVTMVLVPQGCFTIGGNPQRDDERNGNQICFAEPWWIDRFEVTNLQYGSSGSFGDDESPRDTVDWYDARRHCEGRGSRLPTEAEWEYSARGPDNLIYPWGNGFIPQNVVFRSNSEGKTQEVGSRLDGVSWVGAFDMSGNVWEWVNSIYKPFPYDSSDGRELYIGSHSPPRVLKGGSWYNDSIDNLRASFRHSKHPNFWSWYNTGFRCARDWQSND